MAVGSEPLKRTLAFDIAAPTGPFVDQQALRDGKGGNEAGDEWRSTDESFAFLGLQNVAVEVLQGMNPSAANGATAANWFVLWILKSFQYLKLSKNTFTILIHLRLFNARGKTEKRVPFGNFAEIIKKFKKL